MTPPKSTASNLGRRAGAAVARFVGATDAAIAVEFAFIAPILIVMFFATIELTRAMMAEQIVNQMAATAADLTAESTTIASGDMTSIINTTMAVDYIDDGSNVKIVISQILDDCNGNETVDWSYPDHTAHSVANNLPVPTGVIPSCGAVIQATVSNTYTPITSFIVGGTQTYSVTNYQVPLAAATVTYTGS